MSLSLCDHVFLHRVAATKCLATIDSLGGNSFHIHITLQFIYISNHSRPKESDPYCMHNVQYVRTEDTSLPYQNEFECLYMESMSN